MHDDRLYQVALKFIYGIGDINAKQLISYCGSAKEVFKTSRSRLEKIPGMGSKTVSSILSAQVLSSAENEINKCIKSDTQIHFYTDSTYPSRLKLVNDSPLVLFSKGVVDFNKHKTVGIVGTRKATEYGRSTTETIIQDLVAHDPIIVSGLAYGIDITAHREAISSGLATVAVLAGGLDYIYPAAHKKTAKDLQSNGAIVCEQFMGTVPEAHYFPARNRIIAGMSDVVIVVEAAEKGGALITAEMAFSYNREVFAVPGDIKNKYSIGCNNLIARQKANIYSKIDDLEYLLNWEKDKEAKKSAKSVLNIDDLDQESRRIIKVLNEFKQGLHLDELSWKSQVAINQAVSILLNLEFAGHIKALPGKRYKLN